MSIAILNKVKYILRKNFMHALYCAMILPHLTYCVKARDNIYKTNLIFPYLLQKREIMFVKVIYKIVNLSYLKIFMHYLYLI